MTQTTFKTFEEMKKHFETLLSNNQEAAAEIVDEMAEIDKQLEEQNKKKEDAENSINRKQYEQATAKIWELEQRKQKLADQLEKLNGSLVNYEEFEQLTDTILNIYQEQEDETNQVAFELLNKLFEKADELDEAKKNKRELLTTLEREIGREAPEFYKDKNGHQRYRGGMAAVYDYSPLVSYLANDLKTGSDFREIKKRITGER